MSATYKLMMLRRYRLVRALLALSCLFCTVNAAPALHPNEGFRVLTANSIYIFSVNSNKTRSHIFETLYSLVLIYAVEALKDITKTLGVKYLDLSEDPCFTKTLVITKSVLMEGQNSTIRCNCSFNNNRTCHITHL